MKRKTLTTAVLAGVTGVAGMASISNAVNLNPDGLGEVLIYPYYTVNGGNDTLLSVVNTTDRVKAVKVRFVDSKNSREVLDFNLYLSPFDVWTAALTSTSDDTEMVLATGDTSCTVPAIDGVQDGANREGFLANGLPFVGSSTLLFDEQQLDVGDDITGFGTDTSQARTREGHFEMIEMGVVEDTEDLDDTSLEVSAVHITDMNGDRVPLNCQVLVNAWIPGGVWNSSGSMGADTDVQPPDGGLFGGASIINVGEGTQVSYNADAIAAFFDPDDGEATLHRNPGTEQPSLEDARTGALGAPVQSIVFDNGRIVTSMWDPNLNAGAVDAVSAVYMHDQIYNEFAIDTVLNGATEWVNTFPTKRFYVNSDPALPPFTEDYDFDQIVDGAACEPLGITFLDREETDPGQLPGQVNFSPFDPGVPTVPVLCYEAQIITFGQDLTAGPSEIFGSPNARNISTVSVQNILFENGWATLDFTANLAAPAVHEYTSSDGDVYEGLPVTGFAAVVVQNGTLAGGVLSNYAGLFRHRASRSIVGS